MIKKLVLLFITIATSQNYGAEHQRNSSRIDQADIEKMINARDKVEQQVRMGKNSPGAEFRKEKLRQLNDQVLAISPLLKKDSDWPESPVQKFERKIKKDTIVLSVLTCLVSIGYWLGW